MSGSPGGYPFACGPGDRRYVSEGSMAKLYETRDTGDIAALDIGE